MDKKVVVYFRRKFTSGTLKGLTHDDHISFPTEGSARDWLKGVKGREIAIPGAGSPYRYVLTSRKPLPLVRNPAPRASKKKASKKAVRKTYRKNPITPDLKERTDRAMHLYDLFHGESARYVTSRTKPGFPRVAMRIGKILGIMYEAKRDGAVKKFLHEFTGASRPTLISSWDGKQIAIIDGDYDFTADGIVDRKRK